MEPETDRKKSLTEHGCYRIALGPHQGRKAFTLQTVPAVAQGDDNSSVAKAAGFSLHAGVASEAHGNEKNGSRFICSRAENKPNTDIFKPETPQKPATAVHDGDVVG